MLDFFSQQSCGCCDLNDQVDEARRHPGHSKTRALGIALALISGFAIAEVSVGWVSHSLALMAESVHMVSDCAALGLALFASWLGQRGLSTEQPSIAQHRIEAWAALINGAGLLLVALWIVQEAIAHLQAPPEEILSIPMLITAIAGFAVNTLNASLLHGHSHHDLNLRGAFLHMVADAASSVGVILAAIAVSFWHWTWADSLTSLLVALLIVGGSVPLIRQSAAALMSKLPSQAMLDTLKQSIQLIEGVFDVTFTQPVDSAQEQAGVLVQVTLQPMNAQARDRLQQLVHDLLNRQLAHTTVDIKFTVLPPPPLVNLSFPPTLEILQFND